MAMSSGKIGFCMFLKNFNFKLSDPDYKLMRTNRVSVKPHIEILYNMEAKWKRP